MKVTTMLPSKTAVAFLVCATLCCLVSHTDAVAVMSIDLGSENIKVAIVKPGVPMEIVLNKESRRKTPVVVAFREGERSIGDSALNTAVKFPDKAYWYLRELLGKKVDNPIIKQYKQRFPYYDIQKDEGTGTVVFKLSDGLTYSVEELLGMILEDAKEVTRVYAEQPIKDVVITVPVYFNQAERRSLIRAANLAGLNVLQLMNDNAAIALNYGIFRRKSFNSTSQYYMFYDMGATSTTATIVGYKMVQTKENGYSEKNPQVTIKGVGFDRQLGGLEVQLRLRDHLAKLFNEQKKTQKDVTTDKRAMGKLFKEAGRVKQILSANTEFFAQVEGLLDDQDFKAKVARDELEEICKDVFEKVPGPVEMALKISQITMDEISQVILMGGGTRVPKVQELLKKAVGREDLGKSINTDEAAALGAVYQAAYMTKGFKVKKFVVKDANMFPIEVEFDRIRVDADGTKSTKHVKRTLFGVMNPFPQKKVMTFNKHTEDFGFYVGYSDMTHLKPEDITAFDSMNITAVQLKGVADALNKHSKEAESKGVKAHFRLDESGLLVLDKVESAFEKEPDNTSKEEESTLSKLGSTITNFFTGKTDEDEGDVKEEQLKEKEKIDPSSSSEDNKDIKSAKSENKSTDSKNGSGSEKKSRKKNGKEEKEQEKKADDKKEESKSEDKKDNSKEEKKKGNGEEKKNEKYDAKEGRKSNKTEDQKSPPKPVIIKEDLQTDVKIVDLADPTQESIEKSIKKISDLKKKDEDKMALQKIKNELETFIFDSKDKITQTEYEEAATEEERTEFSQKTTETGDWLEYEADDSTSLETFKEKLKALKDQCRAWYARVQEHADRPQAIQGIKDMLNYTGHFYKTMDNFTGEDKPFTKVEQETLQKLINETKKWRDATLKAQKKLPKHKKPVFLLEDVAMKVRALDREVKYLLNKAKYFVPKAKPKEETKSSNETENVTNSTTKESGYTQSNETKTASESSTEKTPDETLEKPTVEGEEKTKDAPRETHTESSKTEETLELPPPEDVKKSKDASEKQGEEKSSKIEEPVDSKHSETLDKEKHKEL